MSIIEDPELRELFQVESEEHLQLLDEGLLFLEKNPNDTERLHEVFREAHSLKGAARMLGVSDVETLSHLIEDILGSASRGKSTLTPEKIDSIYEGLDAIRKFVHEAVTGEPAGIDPLGTIDRLSAEAKSSRQAGIPRPVEEPGLAPEAEVAPEAAETIAPPPPVEPEPESKPEPAAETTPAVAAATPESASAGEDESTVFIDLEGPIAPVTPNSSTTQSPPSTTPAIESSLAAVPAPATAPQTTEPPASPAPTPTPTPIPPAASPAPAPAKAPEAAPKNAPAVTEPNQAGKSAGSASEQYRVDTIRVKPERLDALMTQAGELTVTRIRISRRPQEIEGLIADLEELRHGLYQTASEINRQQPETEGDDRAASAGEKLAETQARLAALEKNLGQLRSNAYEDSARLELITGRLEEGIRQVRMMPLSTVFGLFPRTVRDLAREQSKKVDFIVEGGETLADKRIIEELKDPLMHMVRNAVDHGIEAPATRQKNGKYEEARLWLRAEGSARQIMIEVADDGKGLDTEAIKRKALERRICREDELREMSDEQIHRLIFTPGFSTSSIITDVSGRGVGMDVVMSKVEQLKGSVQIQSNPGQGTSIQLHLPITLSTTRVLLLRSSGNVYALPVDYVDTSRMVPREDIFSIEGKDTVILDSNPVSLISLSDLLPVRNSLGPRTNQVDPGLRKKFPVIFVSIGNDRVGLIVDELIDEQEIILKDQGGVLKHVPNVLGMTILESGAVCVVLNVPDLIKSVAQGTVDFTAQLTEGEEEKKKIVLLVEDSITTRMQEKRILERAGYEVVLAVDGQDGARKLEQQSVNAVVSDVEMPNMNGFELTRHIRARAEISDLPVILVTTLASEENIRTGMEAGANAYITKRSFDQSVLLETLDRLI